MASSFAEHYVVPESEGEAYVDYLGVLENAAVLRRRKARRTAEEPGTLLRTSIRDSLGCLEAGARLHSRSGSGVIRCFPQVRLHLFLP